MFTDGTYYDLPGRQFRRADGVWFIWYRLDPLPMNDAEMVAIFGQLYLVTG